MTKTQLSIQAKALMDAANALDDAVGAKYGANSSVSVTAAQAAIYNWLVLCELERVEVEEVVDKM